MVWLVSDVRFSPKSLPFHSTEHSIIISAYVITIYESRYIPAYTCYNKEEAVLIFLEKFLSEALKRAKRLLAKLKQQQSPDNICGFLRSESAFCNVIQDLYNTLYEKQFENGIQKYPRCIIFLFAACFEIVHGKSVGSLSELAKFINKTFGIEFELFNHVDKNIEHLERFSKGSSLYYKEQDNIDSIKLVIFNLRKNLDTSYFML
ncbi:MAG: hypothetical protein KBD37_04965 [Burkholderiales bacterium]|nr:hypothetical protein [Burkholderiales bacterium]